MPGVGIVGYTSALIVAVVLAILNATLKPIMVFLTIPFTIFTFGLFLLVINACIVLLADKLIDGFTVENFWWAIGFSIVLFNLDFDFHQYRWEGCQVVVSL